MQRGRDSLTAGVHPGPPWHGPEHAEDTPRASAGEIALIDPATDPRWGAFLRDDQRGYLCHDPRWKQLLEGCFPHMKGMYAALIREGGISAALPLFMVKSWLTGNRLVSIPFATLCDPLIREIPEIDMLMAYALRLAGEEGVPTVKISTYETTPLVRHPGYRPACHYVIHVLPLDKDEERVKRTFDRTCVIQKIHRAQKSGLDVRYAQSGEDILDFYALYSQTRRNVGVPPQPYRFFEMLWKLFSPDRKVRVLLASRDGRPLAGLMLFISKKCMSAEYLGYDSRFIRFNPHHLLFWEAIRSGCSEGFSTFDFGRTSVSNAGLLKFKKHWGTEAQELHQWIHPPSAAEISNPPDQSMKYRAVREICRRSPAFMVKHLSNFSYRHLG